MTRRRRSSWRLVVATAALVATTASCGAARLPSPSSSEPLAASPGTPGPPGVQVATRVEVYGDSLAWQAARPFVWFAGLRGWHAKVTAIGGTAPCDLLAPVEAAVAARAVPDKVVLSFAGNSLTPCMAGVGSPHAPGETDPALLDKYDADLTRIASLLEANGAQVFLALPTPGNAAAQALGDRYRQMANRDGQLRLLDPGPELAPAGTFSETAPCLAGEPGCVDGQVRIHGPHDWLHFYCPTVGPFEPQGEDCLGWDAGAVRYALALLPPP